MLFDIGSFGIAWTPTRSGRFKAAKEHGADGSVHTERVASPIRNVAPATKNAQK
ncbi:hypothetical protein [Cupriavidus sp. TMH.W2]|uniref:hypothetical protein n=1 Tax=Cupriavidus sp. TMH.W2 TaxID=3434465 RepID=UPI003D777440